MRTFFLIIAFGVLAGFDTARGQGDALVNTLNQIPAQVQPVLDKTQPSSSAPGGKASGVSHYSAARLNDLEKLGAFTPEFKKAVHDYVDVTEAITQARQDEKKLRGQLPGIEKQTTEATAKADALKKELEEYDHTGDSDFLLLQKIMNDTTAKPEEQVVVAQTYVWSYPLSPHETEAQMYLQQLQKGISDRLQALKDAEAAQAASRAKLLQRVQSRDLSLFEWKDFLQNLSQDDLLKYMGRPQFQQGDYWIYTGAWTYDVTLKQKVGLQITLNGGRVINVVEASTVGGGAGVN